jgi:molecular chaperone DnaK (HSP70)
LVTIGAAYEAYLAGERDEDAEPGPDGEVPRDTTDLEPLVGRTEGEDGKMKKVFIVAAESRNITPIAVGVEVITNADEMRAAEAGAVEPVYENQVVIEEDSEFGEVYEQTFSVAFDGQDEVPIVLYEGAAAEIAGREPLARLSITGFDETIRAGTPVHVELKFDENGIITGKAEAEGRTLDIHVDTGAS